MIERMFQVENVRLLEDGDVDFYYYRTVPLSPEYDVEILVSSVAQTGMRFIE